MPQPAALPPRPAEALRRGPDGRAATSASARSVLDGSRRRDRRDPRPGRRAGARGRRRQHLPRRGGHGGRAWTASPRDHMGMLATVINALALQDALERRGIDDARALGPRDAAGRRAVHPPPRPAPPREGARGDLRRRHRQPVLHDRHRRRAARDGDQGRGAAQGDQGRRRLHRGSGDGPDARAPRSASATSRCSSGACR